MDAAPLPCIKLACFYSLCCFYSFIHPCPPHQRLPRASAKALLASVLCVFSSHSGSNLISFAVSSPCHTPDDRLMAASAQPPHGDSCWDGPQPIYRSVCMIVVFNIPNYLTPVYQCSWWGGGGGPSWSVLSLGWHAMTRHKEVRPHREEALGNFTPKKHSIKKKKQNKHEFINIWILLHLEYTIKG